MKFIKRIFIHISGVAFISLLLILFLYQPIPDVNSLDQYENRMDTHIIKMMNRYDITGVQVTFFDQDKQVNQVYGYKDLETLELLDEQTVFRAQSLSKTITAVLILKLVEEDLLNLDDQLKEVVDDAFLSQIPDIYHDVTIHQILKHEAYMPLGDFNRMFAIDDVGMMSLKEALIHDLNQKRPSGGFFYSNVGYNLLEYIINQVDDQGYEELARTYIFDPLEMTHTSFSYDDVTFDDLAYGYDQFKGKVNHYRYPELGSGGLLSTSNDFYKFLFALINEKIISNNHLELLLSYDSDVSLGSYGFAFDGYGYGVFVEDSKDSVTFSHGGQGLGFMAFYHVDLANQSGYVVMANSQRTYPLISMLSTMFNDNYDLDTPGIKSIHTLMLFFEVLIALTLYIILYIVFLMVKDKWIKRLVIYIVLASFWCITLFGVIYFLMGSYMFIHVLIPIHFEIWIRVLIIFNIILFIFILGSMLKLKKNHLYKMSLKDKLSDIKKNTMIVGLALKDHRTPWYVKIIFMITIAYALSPIDLIPDFIPFIGFLDDLVILPFLVNISIKLIPNEVLLYAKDNYQKHVDVSNNKHWIYAIPIFMIWGYAGYHLCVWIFSF